MSDSQKEIIRLAFSIYSSPGSCALLLGSGVSKSAKIKTGWEVMLDLIQKIADIEKEKPEDLLVWYKQKFDGEDPTYDNLLDRITQKSVERRNILAEYFDPTPQHIEDGQRIPQPAHKSIAKLVKQGYIKVIITTNFDRLLETALLMEGIHPYLIYSDDAIDGCLPPVHIRDSCIIYKIHGDYKDTRLRNTPDELKKYPEKVNRYLERIFEDFGIIVCGWSAEWDVALRKALCNESGHRFGLQWTSVSHANYAAKKIIAISSADNFFVTLQENIEALRRHQYPKDPLTTPIAIEKCKKYISNNDSTQLFDLINNERVSVLSDISSDKFEISDQKLSLQGINFDEEVCAERFIQYEGLIKPLCGICSTIAYFDDDKYARIILSTMENLVYHRYNGSSYALLKKLENYPVYLLNNVVAVIALTYDHYNILASALLRPKHIEKDIRGTILKKPIVESVNLWEVLSDPTEKYCFDLTKPDSKDFVWKHVYNFIFEQVSGYIPNKFLFIEKLQTCKFLSAMIYADLNLEKYDPYMITPYIHEILLLEQFKGKGTFPGIKEKIDTEPILDFVKSGRNLGDEWDLIKAGFFGGKIDRFDECFDQVTKHQDWVTEWTI